MKTHLMIALASLGLASSSLAKEPTAMPRKEVRSPGKPRAAVTVTTDVAGEVTGNTPHLVRVAAAPLGDCVELVTTVYGTQGVEVHDGEARSHGAVSSGVRAEHPVLARVPAGGAGHLVVSTTCVAGGQRLSVVESFVLAAKGPSGQLPQPKRHSLGELTTDSSGRPVRVMQSTPRE
ncbi:MAG: hypothetical protein M3Y59_11960 [Myxococcota bacterium]|nr:hypothetical protein [Myxococcota bacterium]